MPKISRKRRSLDTEATGLDLRHGAKPFLVTMCSPEQQLMFWEWDVDPLTRQPIVPVADLAEIEHEIQSCDELVLQNPKFDFSALDTLACSERDSDNFWLWEEWQWEKVRDTLLAGHLLASNQPHDLTTMALVYLGVNIKPLEDALETDVQACRRIVRLKAWQEKYPGWRIAEEGLPEMPSAKEKTWKFDMWLPRAMIKHAIITGDYSFIPDHPRLPKVVRVTDAHDVKIDRTTKWGNRFVIGRDGTRQEVIRKYAEYVWQSPELLAALPELYGKRIACHCKPEECHGDVLRILCHPWRTSCAEYSNGDSSVTLPLYDIQEKLIRERGYWKLYEQRLKILPIVYRMENEGITISKPRLEKLRIEYIEESKKAEDCCKRIARSYDGYDLALPKNGINKSLSTFVFDVMKLEPFKSSKKTGAPSFDKHCIEHYMATLPERSKQYKFVDNLRGHRKRGTALGFIESYQKFWLPWMPRWIPAFPGAVDPETGAGWYVLHPSLNPTGTDTLRWSSSNPNEQQISKQEGFNLRYMFGPAPGREWWSSDAKNLELRIPAYEAGETEMIDIFERPNDPPYFGSYHLLVFDTLHPDKFKQHGKKCKDIYESTWYQWTKNGNFAVGYGSVESSGTADRAYHVPGAFRLIKGRFSKIHGPGGLNDQQIAFAEKYGYVETIPDKTVDPLHGYPLLCTRTEYGKILPTVPLNYHVQGSAMWWMIQGMIRVQEFLDDLNRNKPADKQYKMIMQVHDELVFDFPRGEGTEPWKTNLPIMREINKLMEVGGEHIGVPTPVSCEYHAETWDVGVAL